MKPCGENEKAIKQRFGEAHDFKLKVNPDMQVWAGKNPEKAVCANFPTLAQVEQAYGEGFAAEWLAPHVTNLSLHTGAKNLNVGQVRELSRIIAAEYHHFKITEILLFLYWFKTGRYGKFYGATDPMVVTCALREFIDDRNNVLASYEQEQRELRQAEERKNRREQRKKTLEWMVSKVNESNSGIYRRILRDAHNNGELAELGIEWIENESTNQTH